MSFESLGLSPCLVTVLNQLGLQTPTAVQRELIPVIRAQRDVMISAPTGSGKTLVYLLPLLDRCCRGYPRSRGCVLVVVPTRELVRQLASVMAPFLGAVSRACKGSCKVVELAGGTSINTQLRRLSGGAQFLLATPGRCLDVIAHNGFDPRTVDVLVLDEADRLLAEGFQKEVDALISLLAKRQRLMVSATCTRKVRARARWLLHDPVTVDDTSPEVRVRQRAIAVDRESRQALLVSLLGGMSSEAALVFAADRKGVEQLAKALTTASLNALALHGKLSTARRTASVAQLATGQVQVLVATDLAARGIDIPTLPLVINYDLPRSVELYTHRIGRTGRAGRPGMAISLVDIDSEAHWQLLAKRLGMQVVLERVAGFEPRNRVPRVSILHDGTGGIKGRHMSRKDKLRAAAARIDPDRSEPEG